MAPPEIAALLAYIERTQSQITDPAERERALAVVEQELTDALGRVQTYRNDNRLAMGEDPGDGSTSDGGEQTAPQ